MLAKPGGGHRILIWFAITSITLILLACVSLYTIPQIRLHIALRPRAVTVNPANPSIVMLGDSHTLIADWSSITGCDRLANLGVYGNTTAQILQRLPAAIALAPRFVYIMAGTNDAIQHVDPATTIRNIQQMETELLERHIQFAVVAPPPLPKYPDTIYAVSRIATFKIPFTENDLRDDQTHLRASGYAKWRDAIAPTIARFCYRGDQ